MTYRIRGLDPQSFAPLFALSDAELAASGARRVTADAPRGYPCRVSLEDAAAGETLILLNHVSHAAATPYHTAGAIYVRQAAQRRADHVDAVPPVFAGRTLSLRGFGGDGMLRAAQLTEPGHAEAGILALFADPGITYIHAHNAAHGCFSALVERHEEMGE